MSKSTDLSFFLLLVLCSQAQGGRLLLSDFNQSTSSADGVHHHHRSHTFAPYLTFENALSAEDSTYKQTYVFLPYTTIVIDNLFLIPDRKKFKKRTDVSPCSSSLAGNSSQALCSGLGCCSGLLMLELVDRASGPFFSPIPRARAPTGAALNENSKQLTLFVQLKKKKKTLNWLLTQSHSFLKKKKKKKSPRNSLSSLPFVPNSSGK
ncbi:hypothetical protein C1H46_019138 [Malus baccata]|uniref:Uncharacterized protein n=1 Tax=Malus baccata TaxID=106549 RepID=A0A540M9V8_MALBA|nr:hypothetical protein C1H46_019138 [Malus baccata]